MSNKKDEVLARIASLIGAANLAGCNSSHVTLDMLDVFEEPQGETVVGTVEVKIDDTMLEAVRHGLNAKEQIFFDIVAERLRQNEQWGGPTVDDTRTADQWLAYINAQKYKAIHETLSDSNDEIVDPEGYRARLVKIAALAVAALESFDRKNPTEGADEEPELRDFDKDELLAFLDTALPDRVGVRSFAIEYRALLDDTTNGIDDALARAAAAARELNASVPRVGSAKVSADYTDGNITIEVEA